MLNTKHITHPPIRKINAEVWCSPSSIELTVIPQTIKVRTGHKSIKYTENLNIEAYRLRLLDFVRNGHYFKKKNPCKFLFLLWLYIYEKFPFNSFSIKTEIMIEQIANTPSSKPNLKSWVLDIYIYSFLSNN